MVFVAGPRQVGKTTLARMLPGGPRGYLNWDVAEDRERILLRELPPAKLWVFDEIHKYRGWRNYLKGLYDGRPRGKRLLVTGSASARALPFRRGFVAGPVPPSAVASAVGGRARSADARRAARSADARRVPRALPRGLRGGGAAMVSGTADLADPRRGIVPFVVELREWRTPCFRTEVVYSTPRQQPHRRAGPARPRRRPGSAGRGSPAPAGSAAPPPPARSPPSVESSGRRATA